ncbi:hypothetical protein CDAR_249411 [Caerostris darwini]|uniref:Uncharacterized protein n=1 Tax=Caerostris darwini TaxID=1538125 RepID=A0AAV4TGS8_9ARAC|nr:hypothetical protein CDAR_249411 [Caerostris darwini]
MLDLNKVVGLSYYGAAIALFKRNDEIPVSIFRRKTFQLGRKQKKNFSIREVEKEIGRVYPEDKILLRTPDSDRHSSSDVTSRNKPKACTNQADDIEREVRPFTFQTNPARRGGGIGIDRWPREMSFRRILPPLQL